MPKISYFLIALNILNLVFSVFFKNLYSQVILLGTVLLPVISLFLIGILPFSLKKIHFSCGLALICNIISVSLLYYLWTKYDVPPTESNQVEFLAQSVFIVNGLFFGFLFVRERFFRKYGISTLKTR
jgi:hypothetical protein